MKSFLSLTVILLTFLGIALNTHAIGVADSDTLASDTSQVRLKEVLVTGSTVRHYGQQDTYQVTKAMREGVSDAGELLGKLNGVTFNPLSGELKYLSSKNIIILVDSIPKDEEYIKRLRPYRFDHITIVNNPSGGVCRVRRSNQPAHQAEIRGLRGQRMVDNRCQTGRSQRQGKRYIEVQQRG